MGIACGCLGDGHLPGVRGLVLGSDTTNPGTARDQASHVQDLVGCDGETEREDIPAVVPLAAHRGATHPRD